MSNKEDVYRRLDALGIPYERHEHEAAHSIDDCYQMAFCAPDLVICKNILLCNRQQTAFYLYVMPPNKPFRTADVSKRLGTSRLSFAPQERLPELLGLYPGSLSPLGIWYDTECHVQLVFDREVHRTGGRIAFHPCDNTSTVIFEDDVFWERVVPALGKELVELDVPWPEQSEN